MTAVPGPDPEGPRRLIQERVGPIREAGIEAHVAAGPPCQDRLERRTARRAWDRYDRATREAGSWDGQAPGAAETEVGGVMTDLIRPILPTPCVATTDGRGREWAITDFTRAIELRSDLEPEVKTRLLNRRGWAHHFADAPRLALDDYESLLKLVADQAEAHADREFARVRLGDWKEAVADADAAVRLLGTMPTTARPLRRPGSRRGATPPGSTLRRPSSPPPGLAAQAIAPSSSTARTAAAPWTCSGRPSRTRPLRSVSDSYPTPHSGRSASTAGWVRPRSRSGFPTQRIGTARLESPTSWGPEPASGQEAYRRDTPACRTRMSYGRSFRRTPQRGT